ncbi:MAG: molybdopterin molybdotransferase MoeA [Nitrospiria bacterium]
MSNSENPIIDARKRFLAAFPQGDLPVEDVTLLAARGRVLARDLSVLWDDPPYNRSIMEGYVLCVSDVVEASAEKPVSLRIAGEIKVGQDRAAGLSPGNALQVTTGSFIPPGAYAVVRAWDVKRAGHHIAVSRPVKPDENIEVQGEIKKKGTALFQQGRRITPGDIFVLASQGILEIPVVRAPKVALFSSGDEVISPTDPLQIGAIWDCNRYGLSSLIEAAGGEPLFQGIMKDDLAHFIAVLKRSLETADMAVISGGTAVGGEDFTASLVNAAGSPGTLVNGIPMRSGKPIVLGVADGKPIVCVAGHPPEAARGFNLFGTAAIARLMGTELPAE